ncbi:adenosylmethionine decarboxylase [Chitinimonas lacunae]|uniref:Adenosylmethionine decarboxylase n=1 Tax=Chitinimonas lacunae TaxID=1963018 RepID=A0ABV8MNZ0_9NEIS
MHGLHLTADLYRCRCDTALLTDAGQLARLCRRHVEDCQLTIVGERWHTFPGLDGQPGGVTGALLLAESHLAVHTWPERGGVTLDIYVCNVSADNSQHAERLHGLLLAAFQAETMQAHRLQRGGME